MISDATVQRYYYIYDSRDLRTLVMDRVTGEEFSWTDDVRTPLLNYVAEQDSLAGEPGGSLRRFALWCARETRVNPDDLSGNPAAGSEAVHRPSSLPSGAVSTQSRVLEAAAAWIERGSDAPVAVRQQTADAAVHAATVGLAQMDPRAAAFLTAQACTHPDAWRAALDAAHMSERFAEFEAAARPHTPAAPNPRARFGSAYASRSASPSPDAAAHDMRMRQIDHLLDLLHDGRDR